MTRRDIAFTIVIVLLVLAYIPTLISHNRQLELAQRPVIVSIDDQQAAEAVWEAQNYPRMALTVADEMDRLNEDREMAIMIRDIRTTIEDANAELDKVLTEEIADAVMQADDPHLILAIIDQESDFRPHAIGGSGEIGLCQIMPSTGRWIARQMGERDPDLADVRTNIRYAIWYLRHVTDRMGGTWEGVLAYNKGMSGARAYLQTHSVMDSRYVREVKTKYESMGGTSL